MTRLARYLSSGLVLTVVLTALQSIPVRAVPSSAALGGAVAVDAGSRSAQHLRYAKDDPDKDKGKGEDKSKGKGSDQGKGKGKGKGCPTPPCPSDNDH
jgi:hypothetical protein